MPVESTIVSENGFWSYIPCLSVQKQAHLEAGGQLSLSTLL